jgi:hypothetical protein
MVVVVKLERLLAVMVVQAVVLVWAAAVERLYLDRVTMVLQQVVHLAAVVAELAVLVAPLRAVVEQLLQSLAHL